MFEKSGFRQFCTVNKKNCPIFTMKMENLKEIFRLNKNRSGIYRLIQKDTKASYIGNASNLTLKYIDYLSIGGGGVLTKESTKE